MSRLFKAYSRHMALYAQQWLNRASAEDIVQDVYIRLMMQKQMPQNIKAWLFRSVRNDIINRSRHRKVQKKHAQQAIDQQQSFFESRPDDLIDAETAQNILASLPDQIREIVILRIWGQMTLREVAEIVNQPVSTVHSRYNLALETIKKKMGIQCKTKQI